MPETAEVHLLMDGFVKFISAIKSVEINSCNGVKLIKAGKFRDYQRFKEELEKYGKLNIESHGTKGKVGWLRLTTSSSPHPLVGYLTFHFGMSGNFRFHRGEVPKHGLVKFTGDDGAREVETSIWYHDIRRFGRIQFLSEGEFNWKMSKLGHDLLTDSEMSKEDLLRRVRRYPEKNICKLMLEQGKVWAGIGNYMVSEILYENLISPYRKVNQLSDEQIWDIYRSARDLAKSAYQSGGASLYTFTGMNGDQSNFKEQLKVYGKKRDPRGNEVVTIPAKDSPDGRTKHVVPALQLGS